MINRRLWAKIHLWLGLVLGLFWAVQGLTGALLVFSWELDAPGAKLASGPMLPPTVLIRAAEAATGHQARWLQRFGNDPRLIEVQYKDDAGAEKAIHLDAASARVVKMEQIDPKTPFAGSAWRWVVFVHSALVTGLAGRLFVAISSTFLLFSLGLGLYLGWPRARAWGAAFAVRKWRARPQQLFGWHRAAGLVVALGLMVLALSGIYIEYLEIAQVTGLTRIYPATIRVERRRALPSSPPLISADQAVAVAQAQFPKAKLAFIMLPRETPGLYQVRLIQPGEWRGWQARTTVVVDAMNGAVLRVYDPMKTNFIHWLDDNLYVIHTGGTDDLPGRLAVMFGGLCLPGLYVTGLWLWRERRRMSRARAKA